MGELADLEEKKNYSKEEVSQVLKISVAEIEELEREGVIDCDKHTQRLDRKNLERLQAALALKKDLGVNAPGIDIILNMREKIDQLQNEFEGLLSEVRDRLGDEIVQDLREIEANIKRGK